MNNRINLYDHYPIIGHQNGVCICNNGNMVLGYQIEYPEIYSLSEDHYDALHGSWYQALKNLSSGTIIHKQDFYIYERFEGKSLLSDSFLSLQTKEYFKGREYLKHRGLVFFIYSLNKGLNHEKFINPFYKIDNSIYEEVHKNIDIFKKEVEQSVLFLNNSRLLSLESLSEGSYEKHVDFYFNGFKKIKTDIELKEEIKVGDNYFDFIGIQNEENFGETISSCKINESISTESYSFYEGFLERLGLDLMYNHMTNTVIYLDDSKKWKTILNKKRQNLFGARGFGNENKLLLDKIDGLIKTLNQDEKSRLVRSHFNICFWDENVHEIKKVKNIVQTRLKELDIQGYEPLDDERKNYFLNSFFAYSSNFNKYDLFVMDLRQAICLFNNTTNYKSDEEGIIFCDRLQNIPVKLDVWDEAKKRIKARNFAIFAPTGEGKSFLANNILRQFYDQGIRLVIIDLGGSYSKFGALYPEDYIELRYEEGQNLGINPFYISEGSEITSEQIEDLTEFIEQLLFSNALENTQSVSLKRIIKNYYEEVPQAHSMQSLYDFLKNNPNLLDELDIKKSFFELDELLHLMGDYVLGGIYSYLFDVKEDQTYRLENKRIIVFELDQAKDNGAILKVMLQLIKSAIKRTIWKNKKERGIILFDEFAKQLKFEGILESVEFYYQAIRKQNGAIGIILQSIVQLPGNDTSSSILENTQVIYSLRNEKGYESLVDRLKLSKHDHYQLHSLRNDLVGERKYTEIFIKIGGISNVYRLEVPRSVYAAYLTDGPENEKIMDLFKAHGSMESAILEYIKP